MRSPWPSSAVGRRAAGAARRLAAGLSGRAAVVGVPLLWLAVFFGLPGNPVNEGNTLTPIIDDADAAWDHPVITQLSRNDRIGEQ